MTELYQHEFRPWTIEGDRCVMSDDAHWDKPKGWRILSEIFDGNNRPRVRVVPDVFEDCEHVCNDSGSRLRKRPAGAHLDCSALPHWSPVTLSDIRRDLSGIIDETPNLDWMLETRYPENVPKMWSDGGIPHLGPMDRSPEENTTEWANRLVRTQLKRMNVILGVRVHTQAEWDRLVPELVKCRDLVKTLYVILDPREAISFWDYIESGMWAI